MLLDYGPNLKHEKANWLGATAKVALRPVWYRSPTLSHGVQGSQQRTPQLVVCLLTQKSTRWASSALLCAPTESRIAVVTFLSDELLKFPDSEAWPILCPNSWIWGWCVFPSPLLGLKVHECLGPSGRASGGTPHLGKG